MFPIKFPLLCAIKCYFIALFLAKNGAVMRILKR
jgi:hypothetical protein